jgi:hypothetical protein
MNSSDSRSKEGLLVAAGVAFVFAAFQLSCSVNFPIIDDYGHFFAIAEEAARDGWGVFSYANITEQTFSHRPIAVRIAGALQVLITGKLDFSVLRALGVSLQIAAFAVICVGLYRGRPWSAWWVALLSLIYFQPQLSGSFSMAMQGPVQLLHLAVAGAFVLRSTNATTGRWLAAWLCASFGLLASINAFLVAPLLLLWDVLERRWKWAVGSIAFSALLLLFYFLDYKLATHSGSREFVLADVVPGFLLMLGGVFKFGPWPFHALMVAGGLLLLASLWCVWQSIKSRNGFVAAMLLYFLGSTAMVAVGRAGWGLDYMLQWRYVSFSLMLLLVVVGSLLPHLMVRRKVAVAAVLTIMLFTALAWHQYAARVINEGRAATSCAMSWWLGTPAFFEAIAGADELIAQNERTIRSAIEAGIYDVPMRKEAGALAEACQRPLPEEEVTLSYSVAVAGYRARLPSTATESTYILFANEETGSRVAAARSAQGLAIRRLLQGKAQSEVALFCVPRTTQGSDIPNGTFFVP